MGEADGRKRLAGADVHIGFSLPMPRVRQQDVGEGRRPVARHRNLDVLQNAEIFEDPDVLERARKAEPGDAVRLEPENLATGDTNGAGVRMRSPAQRVEERRLAGAVRTDDRLYDA